MKQLGPRETAGYAEFAELAPAKPISGRAAYDRYIEHTQTKAHADRNFKGLVGASKPFALRTAFVCMLSTPATSHPGSGGFEPQASEDDAADHDRGESEAPFPMGREAAGGRTLSGRAPRSREQPQSRTLRFGGCQYCPGG